MEDPADLQAPTVFAFCLPFHSPQRYPVGMPAPERNRVQVVRCKGCKRCIPIAVDAPVGSVTVRCPVCLERRSYIASTEVFLGQPSWDVTRSLQSRQ